MNDKIIAELREFYADSELDKYLLQEEKNKWFQILSRIEAAQGPVKDCGFTLATCPYERCSGMTMRKEAVEPLDVIAALCKRAFATSKAHGWKHDNDGQAIALMHSELSEALEAMRKPDQKDEHLPHLDPVGLELADVLIRVFDFCGARGIDLATCIKEKMDYNDRRPMKHGGKEF